MEPEDTCAAHIWVMDTSIAPSYHALKNLYDRTRQGGGLLTSQWTEADTEAAYAAMVEFFPADTKVTAVYPSGRDLSTFKTFTGAITGTAHIDVREPDFHIQDERCFTILLPGSLLSIQADEQRR